MDNLLPVPGTEPVSASSGRSKRQWLLLLLILVIAAFVIFIVLKSVKPVSLRHQPTLAAAAVNLSWSILDPQATVSSKIYRTTDKFLEEPLSGALIATVPAPTATYSDTNVVAGAKYYYSIFEVDAEGDWFDPSYFVLSAGEASTGGTPTPLPPAPSTTAPPTLADASNFLCQGDPTVHVYYKGQKESYPSAEVFFLWNTSFSGIVTLTQEQCSAIATRGLVQVPQGTLVKVPSAPTVYLIEGTTARPVASLTALYKISAQPKIITISVDYLHTYSAGAPVY
jgi:hypothetical protein